MAHQRAEQKQRTRARILAAARKLFVSVGYGDTTIRMLASEASVAAGSVFTTFSNKEDVLLAIAAERSDELANHLARRLAEATGPARARLKLAFEAAYAFEQERLALQIAHLGASWTWSEDMERRSREQQAKPFGIFRALLVEAARSGELRREVDVDLLADMLFTLYLRNFRHAWYRQLAPPDSAALAARQIDLVFDGACSNANPAGRAPDGV